VSALTKGTVDKRTYMIEVFKTDVTTEFEAMFLMKKIHSLYAFFEANFDLSDCDRILRVKGVRDEADICSILSLVRQHGHTVEVLTDDPFSNGGSDVMEDLEIAHS
jgi:hypothetical protein